MGDGGFVWMEAVAGPTLSHVREVGFFFLSLSVLWCGTEQEFNLFCFFRSRNFGGVVTLVTDGLGWSGLVRVTGQP